jgi:hypothetical protein
VRWQPLAVEVAMLGAILISTVVVIASLFGCVLLKPYDGAPTTPDFSQGWSHIERK